MTFDHTTGATWPVVQRILAGEQVGDWEIHQHVASRIRKRLEAGEQTEGLVDLFIEHSRKAMER